MQLPLIFLLESTRLENLSVTFATIPGPISGTKCHYKDKQLQGCPDQLSIFPPIKIQSMSELPNNGLYNE